MVAREGTLVSPGGSPRRLEARLRRVFAVPLLRCEGFESADTAGTVSKLVDFDMSYVEVENILYMSNSDARKDGG
jgi:hypothetical protein